MFVEPAQFRFKGLRIGKIYHMEIYFSCKFRLEFFKKRCYAHMKATSHQIFQNDKIYLTLRHDSPIEYKTLQYSCVLYFRKRVVVMPV
jgi:hypothetical protein